MKQSEKMLCPSGVNLRERAELQIPWVGILPTRDGERTQLDAVKGDREFKPGRKLSPRLEPTAGFRIIRMKNTVVGRLRYKDPAAYRPQPVREGPDFWPTLDRGLISALVYEVVPALPVGVIWEAAAGAEVLPLRPRKFGAVRAVHRG
jgi:hypothetical protein